jgi:transporter family protein
MSSELKGIIVGGLLPAFLYGVTGILQKLSAKADGGAGMYLIFLGIGTFVVGMIFHLVLPEPPISFRPASFALAAGISFSLGAGLISFALIRHQAAIAQLTPLYNMNVLITVVIGLAAFAEYRDLHTLRLLGGTALLLVGGVLVASA